MKRSRDPLQLTPNWHVDCRIEVELPEDNLIGTRFIVHVVFTAAALGALLYTGWLGFVTLSLQHQIHDWERRIDDNRSEVRDIQRMQKEYSIEAIKIDQAHALVRPQFFVSGFIADLGRTRPDQMAIDLIDWNEAGISLRGNIRAKPERALQLIGSYVDTLNKDEKIGPLFREINVSDMDRGTTGEMVKFEVIFRLKPSP